MKIGCWLARGLAIAAIIWAGVGSPAVAQNDTQKNQPPVVKVGSKVFTENVILGEMIALLARDAGADVTHKNDLGGTPIVFKSLVNGAIDVYAEYTGTLAGDILAGQSARNDHELRAALAKRGIKMGERLGFNNKYAMGLKETLAKQLDLTRISQLADKPELRMGFSEEFMNRSDGWPGLVRHYGLPQRPRVVDHSLAYHGLEQGAIDVTDLFSTDAEVRDYELRLLEDDRGYFPQYHCVLLYRADLEERAPAVVKSIRRLEGLIDNQEMLELNSRVKLDHQCETTGGGRFSERGPAACTSSFPSPSRWREVWKTTQAHLFLVRRFAVGGRGGGHSAGHLVVQVAAAGAFHPGRDRHPANLAVDGGAGVHDPAVRPGPQAGHRGALSFTACCRSCGGRTRG